MFRRSVHYANYSIYRLRGFALLCVMAAVGVAVGAVMSAADMLLIGALGLGEFHSEAAPEPVSNTLMALGVTVGMAALALAVVVWISDRCAPLMVRTRESDRLNSRWGLRWVSVSFALIPFVFVAVVLALMALGFGINS
ncbi:MAG: hypothetical protein HZB14_09325 [Actinobacteria bacterium]|nr:hypothetical protein [Actinomycetota bacterium]